MNSYLLILFLSIFCIGILGDAEKVYAQNQSDDSCYALHMLENTTSKNIWDNIPEVSSDFHYPWRTDAPEPTRFQAFTDGTKLHFRFLVTDKSLVLPKSDKDERAVDDADRVEIFFAPGAGQGPMTPSSLNRYYALEFAPDGLTHDYKEAYYRKFNSDWDAENLETNVTITPDGYNVLGSVPLVPIVVGNTPVKISQKIWAGVFRADFQRDYEKLEARWISWIDPATKDPDFHVESAFGCWKVTQP